MPIYLLGSRTASVDIPNQRVSISISGPVEGATLYADATDQQNVVQVNPHAILAPSITEQVTVRVEPNDMATFDHGTIVHLTLRCGSPTESDPVQVRFDPINVSGCGTMELVSLTPHRGHIAVALRAVPDVPLSPLASMARTAARRIPGSRRSPRGGSLSIAVDTSASMKRAFDDGSVPAAIDAVIGVANTLSIRTVTAMLVGARCIPIQAATAELAQVVAHTPVRWSAGTRWSLLSDTEHTLVITDSMNFVDSQQSPAVCVSYDTKLPATGPVLGVPPDGMDAGQYLSANPTLVDEFAAALLPVLT
ncbi:hypothetical protein [Mycobacterium sp.]|uniref:hypothetical protein n=1 Tax=Mycobacterium sp. TaxID=1785 RepID=UPI00120635C2|nr:hypothetical protein [Mycobacterium sp.]TAM71511.1 MAG: hypothetical protein EPN51_06385 [Mycobacterium sp.]